jgi:hypothetical protein
MDPGWELCLPRRISMRRNEATTSITKRNNVPHIGALTDWIWHLVCMTGRNFPLRADAAGSCGRLHDTPLTYSIPCSSYYPVRPTARNGLRRMPSSCWQTVPGRWPNRVV